MTWKGKLFLSVGAILLLLGGVWAWRTNRPQKTDPRSAILISGSFYDIDSISLDGIEEKFSYKEGEIRRGENLVASDSPEGVRVMRLIRLRELSAREPILFSRSIDPSRLLDSINNLKTEEKDLLVAFGWKDELFPSGFLESYALTSQAWNKFETDVSEANADIFLLAQEKTVDSYKQNIGSLERKILNLKKNGLPILASADYVTLGGETSTNLDIILSDLRIMRENAISLDKELERRKECALDASKCSNKNVLWPELSLQDQRPTALFSEQDLGLEGVEHEGIFAVSSACWKLEGPAHVYTFKKCPPELGFCFSDSQLADKIYFTKLGDYYPFDIYLKNKGVEVIPQNATTPYECNDLEYYSEINLLDYASENITPSNIQLPENISKEVKDKVDELKDFEEEFLRSDIKNIKDLNKLAEAYKYLSFTLKDIAPEVSSYFLEKYFVVGEGTVDMDLTVNKIAGYLRNFRQSFVQKNGHPSEGYVYAIRNAYSYLFLNFSPTMWISARSPKYLESQGGLSGEVNSVMDYKTALDRYGEKNLSRWAEIFREEDKFRFYGIR